MPPFFSRWLLLALLAASVMIVFALLAPKFSMKPIVFVVAANSGENSWHLYPLEDSQSNRQVFLFESDKLAQALNWQLDNRTQVLLRCFPLRAMLRCQSITAVNNVGQAVPSVPNLLNQPSVFQCIVASLNYLLLPLFALCLVLLFILLRHVTNSSLKMDVELEQLEKHLSQYLQREQNDIHEKERLLREASHDLRTRLHAVQLLAYALQQDAPPAMQAQVGKLNVAIRQLQEFIQEFLSFSRLQQGAEQVQLVRLHLQDVFQALELQFEDIALEQGIQLHIRACDLWLTTDMQLLQRILGNLVSNALKFARHRVLLVARKRQEEIWIEVRDDGPGIPLEEQGAVFSAFYRSSQTAGKPGLGLGLAIVQRLATCLHYRVELISKPGQGSLLRLIVPRPADEQKMPATDDLVDVRNE